VLVALGNEEAELRVAVTTTVLISEEVSRRRENLCLHEGRHIEEVEVGPRAPESPRGHIVRTRG
jgi:hypothetical protein